ncbi:MAG: PAS domain S-box protein [Pseudaminobacter sp.]|nr:PAS domain S-box protein [Pseudaminobacter sp.]
MVRAEATFGPEGKPLRAVGVILDVTERRRTETALEAARGQVEAQAARQAAILGQLAEGVIVADRDGRIIFVNDAASRIHGVARLDVTPAEYTDAYHLFTEEGEPYPPEKLPLTRAVRDSETVTEARWRIRRPDGTEVVAIGNAQPIITADGTKSGAVLTLRDDTARDMAEHALRESEERFRLVADSAPVMLWMGDQHGKCVYLNLAQREFWGVALDAISGFDWSLTIHPDDIASLSEPFAKGMRERSGFSAEARYLRTDGQYRILHTDAKPRFGAGGDFLGMIGVNVDVTETRDAEQALRRETRALAVVNETGAAVAAELDLEKIVQTVTDAGVELTGAQFGAFFYNVLDEAGESYMLYALSGVNREAFSKFPMPRATAIFRPTFHGEGILRSDDILRDPRYGKNAPYSGLPTGHLPVRSYLAVPVTSRSGEVVGGLFFGNGEPGVFRKEHEDLLLGIAGHAAIAIDNARLFRAAEDELAERRRAEEALHALNATLEQRVADEVAERSKAEDALRQAQKMEAVGQLTGGIAHDFNNMLAVVIGGLNLLERRLAKGETDVGRYIDAAMDGATRAASLTQRLLAFSRQQPLQPEPLDANRLVSGMSELLSRTLGENIRVESVLSAGLWKTNVDPGQLENTLLNLSVNARDAMPDGGKLTIETANAHVDDQYAREFEIAAGQYVLICVTDTGSGMSPEIVAKAFDPFFTTKEVGKGTGLGLSQVFGFVRQSGGHVKIYSEPGHGTTAKIYMPRFYGDAPVDAPRRVEAAAQAGNRSEIIMVVEDEERVRNYSVEALRDLGYTVVQASSGPEALRMIEEGQDMALLFTDVVMPEMTGRQLADLAVARLPTLKVLFTTGYTRNAVVHNGVLDPGTHFLPKPFGIDQLASKVRGVLDGS